WRRAIKASGVSDFRFHDLRHTAATRTLRACRNINVVSKLLGHSSILMTQRYAHATQDDVLDAMEATAESRKTPAESADAEFNTLKNKRESA
ncbi:MAG: tyrosine-type recombinase/integrase, partial [Alphaproteobacteria bacterium]|nr:tyrosine-type recombinase/integrase [Alphaproteobacteria bacterium]